MSSLAEPPFHLDLKTRVGAIQLDVSLTLTARWTVIFGPSGSGKTTVLRSICGLVPEADMLCTCGGEVLQGHQTAVATRDRNIAYAPQGSVLFPHLNVRENVDFAARARGVDRDELVEAALDLFQLRQLVDQRPSNLSGGERQRVNLARAFAVPQPRVMLLDEPFTGIGRAQRDVLLPAMRERMAGLGVPVISVTHDVEEAFLLGAEVVRLEAGKVVAQGQAEVVLDVERQETLKSLRG